MAGDAKIMDEEGYKETLPSDGLDDLTRTKGKSATKVEHDKIVKELIEGYRKAHTCRIFRAKRDDKHKDKNCDLIIVCASELCKDGFLVLIEVKTGKNVADSAAKQLEVGAHAAIKAGFIPKKPDAKTLDKCYHSIVFGKPGSKEPKDASKLSSIEANKTDIGDGHKITPKWTSDKTELPKP